MEIYDYPGKFKEQGVGERYAKIQLESEQARDHRRHANGDSMSLFPGGLTTLTDHPQDAQNIEYLIVHAAHTFMAEAYATGSGMTSGAPYYGSYELLPSSRPFRAPILTPKPLIHGIQTAKVVTKDEGSNEEIDVEELTEIYVRFYWDRKNKRSCKLRCAQVWSGKKWGGQFIPRVGQEAVIEFLDGDPDRPLVVGTVYNDDYKPPYDLPSNKTIAGIKSDSSKGGNGYNEWNFEDMKGSEKITVHAEKDLDVTVQNAETRTIGKNFVPPKGSPSRDTTLVNGDDNLTIQKGDQTINIPLGSQTTTAMVTITIQVGASTITMSPGSISLTSPTISLTAVTAVNIAAPTVNIGAVLNTPSLMAGAAVVSGVPV
jgi:type VI secretion system secreted protein VgrG